MHVTFIPFLKWHRRNRCCSAKRNRNSIRWVNHVEISSLPSQYNWNRYMTLRAAVNKCENEGGKNVVFLYPMMIMSDVVIGTDTVLVSFAESFVDDDVDDDMDATVWMRWPVSVLCSDDDVLLTVLSSSISSSSSDGQSFWFADWKRIVSVFCSVKVYASAIDLLTS